MIDGLKPYPVMKDSGAPWLGAVPKHWDVLRLGALLRERGETNDNNSMTEVLSVMRERGVIPYAEKGNVGNKKSEDITRYKIVRPNDIVVNCMNVIIGSVGLSKYTGCLSPVYYVLTRRSETDDAHYLNAYFQTKPFQLSLVRIGNGILAHRMRIPMELLKCEPFPRPPADEQTAIVRFLEYADRRIKRYIRAKQKLIKLLEEQKQAIIHHAVTRGVDHSVRLRPSGVEWLGEVPEHWEVLPLKRLVARGTSISYGIVQPGPNVPGGIRFLQTTNISKPQLMVDALQCTSPEIAAAYPRSRLTGGEVILGIRASIGAAHVVPYELAGVNLSRGIARIATGPKIEADYLTLFLRSRATFEFWGVAKQGTTFNEVSIETVRALPVVVPPLREQTEIVHRTRNVCEHLNRSVSSAEQEIFLLREYRTRLMTDVVTGKLDVREAAAQLPEEVPEVEPLDEMEDMPEDEGVADDEELAAADAA
jgi:type I restriction enzyme S subunit